MKIYISGKIGSDVVSKDTRKKFTRAEEKLKAEGWEVFNPASEEWQNHLRVRYKEDSKCYQPYIDGKGMPDFYTYALLRDLMALSVKDAIYMLSDYQDSPGALAELDFARAIGIDVIFEDAEEYISLKEKLAVLNSIATEYGGKTLENIITGIGQRIEFFEKKENK